MSRADKIAAFDPNSPGEPNSNIYGLPFDTADAEIVIVPVPWDVTVSYRDGTSRGPEAIRAASLQVDLFDPCVPSAWKIGLAMDEMPLDVAERSLMLREDAKACIAALASVDASLLDTVNEGSDWLNAWVEQRAAHWLDRDKLVALVGGDHSTPLGLMRALARRHASFGILQIDAHADLRDAYEGFRYSHASIMHNALRLPQVTRLTQVGIRDYCEEEVAVIEREPRVKTFFDRDLKRGRFEGATWQQQVKSIVETLPKQVYVSFDIDGLDPKLCPNTGTPVGGGFEFEEALYLIETVARSGRTIIGLDVNEVSPGDGASEWDANVGARLLFRMCNLMALSNGLA